jgi:hypothetical protein
MTICIVIKSDFVALHSWPGCPYEEVAFLRSSHRHKFYVTVKFKVTNQDREREFFVEKSKIDKYLFDNYHNKDMGSQSCEMIATAVKTEFSASYVSVFEDDENGAEVYD